MDPKEITSAVTIAAIWLLVLLGAIVIAVGCSAAYQQNILLKIDTSQEEQIYEPNYYDEKPDKQLPIHTSKLTN